MMLSYNLFLLFKLIFWAVLNFGSKSPVPAALAQVKLSV
jgi:hypothetical protein